MEPNNEISTGDDGKTAGIVSYFFILGWLIAYFAMHQNNKTSLGSYQLRQTLLFHIIAMIIYFILNLIFYTLIFEKGFWAADALSWFFRAFLIILWAVGFLGAINGEKKPIPLIGEKAQSLFANI
jgi:uncharacterized membrane protein